MNEDRVLQIQWEERVTSQVRLEDLSHIERKENESDYDFLIRAFKEDLIGVFTTWSDPIDNFSIYEKQGEEWVELY